MRRSCSGLFVYNLQPPALKIGILPKVRQAVDKQSPAIHNESVQGGIGVPARERTLRRKALCKKNMQNN